MRAEAPDRAASSSCLWWRAGEAEHWSVFSAVQTIHRSGECMKRLLVVLVFLALHIGLLAQDSGPAAGAKLAADSAPVTDPQAAPSRQPASSADRMFFPKDWYWGWAQFDIAPPHNEVDPNMCAANAGQLPNSGGKNAQCNAFARYMI